MTSETLSLFQGFNLPTREEMDKIARSRHVAAVAMVSQPGRFVASSLQAWLAAAKAAGVPCIDAEIIGRVDRDTVLRSEEPTPADVEALRTMQAAVASVPPSHMVRWDPCAPFAIKHAMGILGAVQSDDLRRLDLCDPRAFSIIYEYPGDSIAILARPWVEALRVDTHPVEFRVFVQNSRLLGVASYYPQRALPVTAEMLGYVSQCQDLAQALVDDLDAAGQYPWMPSFEATAESVARFEPGKVSASLDFLVDKDGKVLFLEAGPPWGAGAHPCSFLDREVKGTSLALADGVKLR